jgi:hypothetical protein
MADRSSRPRLSVRPWPNDHEWPARVAPTDGVSVRLLAGRAVGSLRTWQQQGGKALEEALDVINVLYQMYQRQLRRQSYIRRTYQKQLRRERNLRGIYQGQLRHERSRRRAYQIRLRHERSRCRAYEEQLTWRGGTWSGMSLLHCMVSLAERHLAEMAGYEPYLAGADCRSAVARFP